MEDRLNEMRLDLIETGEWKGIECPVQEALMLHEVFDEGLYDGLFRAGDRVLDIGAHVGCASVVALRDGASHVVAIEPYGPNVRACTANLRRAVDDLGAGEFAVIKAAIGDVNGTTVYRVGRGSAFSFGTVAKSGSRPLLEVPVEVIGFEVALEISCPDVLKIDCEGAEYESLLPYLRRGGRLESAEDGWRVDRISGELHVNTQGMWEAAVELCGRLDDLGFSRKRLALPKKPGGWPHVNEWRR